MLEPGQVAVIGCRPEQKRGLGTFFFTQAVAHSDQRLEKLILIWASRNLQGVGPDDRSPKAKRSSLALQTPGRDRRTRPRRPATPGPVDTGDRRLRRSTPQAPRPARPDAGEPATTPPKPVCPRQRTRPTGSKPIPFEPITQARLSSEPDRVIYNAQAAVLVPGKARSRGLRCHRRAEIVIKSSWTARAARAGARSSAPL